MQENTITHPPTDEHNRPVIDHQPPKPKQKEGWRSILSTVAILLSAPFIALILITFVFQSYEVEGPSMQNTLHDRDRLIVLKLGKTWSRLTHKSYIPNRGDIVVFHRPQNAELTISNDKQLIKRVVALPGERVKVTDGVLSVYNDAHPDGFQPDAVGGYKLADNYTTVDGEWTVQANQVFVCGDNRENSLDSRSFGPIETKEIVGSLALRVYPFSQFDAF
jgi:signal peptidase I